MKAVNPALAASRSAQCCADRTGWVVFFFKQKTAYEMRISDWSSDVCSSDLRDQQLRLIDGQPGFRATDVQARQRKQRSAPGPHRKIGRASCRERVCQYV